MPEVYAAHLELLETQLLVISKIVRGAEEHRYCLFHAQYLDKGLTL